MSTTIPRLARADFLEGCALIGGKAVQGSGNRISVLNPATGAVLGSVPDLGADAAGDAVAAAEAALPSWKALPAKERSERIKMWHDAVVAHRDDLALLITAEQGKPYAEAQDEISYAASFLQWFAEEGKRAYGELIPGPHVDKRLLVLKEPVGVVGGVTPWNFPSAMITRKVGPALAAGCTIVIKPSELTPFSALALARLALESGIPAGVFNVVTGQPQAIGAVLTTHPSIRKFTFTGSTKVGKLLTAQCAGTMKRVSMELGGNAPLIIFDDADLELALEGTLSAKFRNSGQTCVCANRILVHESVHDRFVELLAARVAGLRLGNGLDGVTDQGPLINEAAIRKVEEHVDDALARGAKVVIGGRRDDFGPSFFQPTIVAGAAAGMRFASEETFGPVAPIFRFRDEAEAIAMANATQSGLAAYAFSSDLRRFWRISEQLRFGMIGFNTGLISSELAPFGGVGESGVGREGSRHGLDEYLDLKTISLGLR